MHEGRSRSRGLAAFLAAMLCGSTAVAGPPTAAAPPTAPSELIPPKLVVGVGEQAFEYPPALLEREQPPAGQITLEYVVGIDGVPIEITVLESPDPALDPVAINIVAKLRYEPASYEGERVEVKLSLAFVVEPPRPPEPQAPTQSNPNTEAETQTPQGDDPEAPVRVLGRVREAGYRTPIEGASVLVIPAGELPVGEIRGTLYEDPAEPAWTVQTQTDASGNYELRGVPEGKVRLIVLASGYARSDRVVELKPDKQLEINVWPRREAQNPYRTEVVVDREAMPEVVERTLELEEIAKLPGSQGDALKAVLNFPGVARAPFGSGLLAIRGAAPEDSAVFLGYHEIPLLFHFGGLRSVFASEILAQIDFIPGNFDSRYGDAIGGIVNVQPRAGRRDGYHGYVDVNAFDAGVLAEGPIGKGSFALAARRSYIDFVLSQALPADAGINFSVAPRYWDYQMLFDYPVSGGELSVRAFGSSDQLKLAFSGPNDDPEATEDVRNQVETSQYFSRLDLVYRKQLGPWEFLVTPSFRAGLTEIGVGGVFDLDVRTKDISGRAELSRQISKNLRWRIGTDVNTTLYDIDVTAPPATGVGGGPGFSSANSLVRRVSGLTFRGALYSTVTLALTDRFVLYPGVRAEWFAAVNRAGVDPRLRGVWKLTDTTALKAAVGLYSQGIQQPVQLDELFGNPRLGLQKSVHSSLAVAQELPWESFIELTGFYKELWDLVSPSAELVSRSTGELGPEQYANTGVGRIYGLELLLRKSLTDNLFGWVSYTLSRSTRIDAPGQQRKLFDFDQTHILTVIGSYKFPRGWQFGARFRLVSGNPYTAVNDGVFDAQAGIYTPITGPVNGDRLPTFHQLDLRLDKTWVLPALQMSVYADVQNVYNKQNPEFINYAYDYQSFSTVNSLPIIPSIGFRVEL
ncbi:TonB family protein / TonB-dependent receptor [Enhygromyxa salina]|uniref:TonB family protein / TonB-dependent receptor n=1 Tax=Enhygromyxa salina TaxID=215803 RepID=A0A0C2D8X1_9BACT|nr:carboxypeptidase regulatory-like domain-containing protein [Enhygromyxa salina]KIG18060.1 TonB family protein / TonB-dependent receptor [Enhygromyxa salina]